MNIDHNKLSNRFISVIVILVLIAVLIIIRAICIMTINYKEWTAAAKIYEKDNIPVQQQRGRILSDEGKVLVCSTPEYEFVFKYKEQTPKTYDQQKRDSMVFAHMKGICDTLSMVIPDQSSAEFQQILKTALKGKKSYTRLYPKRLTFMQYKTLHTYLGDDKGFIFDEKMVRKNTYGNVAARVLGRWDMEAGKARDGIELAYDSLLKGKPGIAHRRKVMQSMVEFIDEAPQNGCDIVTTLNIPIQDMAERSLMKQMVEQNADYGAAIVMEVKTGDLKAVVNLSLENGTFVQGNNIAINQGIETGSIFKTASILAALDDQLITLEDSVDTYPYIRTFYKKNVEDATKKEPVKTIPEVLKYSSNIGTMMVIDEQYVQKGREEAFRKKLVSMGLDKDHAVLPGAARSKLASQARIKEWKGTALWMSIGYGISVTPLNMVTFYAAIANGGKMMQPRLVKEITQDGKTILKNKVETAIPKIASSKAIEDITSCLLCVVNEEDGTGHRAQSDQFLIAGKTGTALISEHNQYAGRWMNFCGFFPADAPEYACGVFVFRKASHTGSLTGGGSMSAPVLREIAEGIMAYKRTMDVDEIEDSLAQKKPSIEMIKKGNRDAADIVLGKLRVRGDSLRGTDSEIHIGIMPDVRGMGAKDAIYAIEKAGAHATLKGKGQVCSQSLQPGATLRKNSTIELQLKN